MILDGISRYGAYFKGISVISELSTVWIAESLSNWDVSRRRGQDPAVFIYWAPLREIPSRIIGDLDP